MLLTKFDPLENKICLDMDGVLADFDKLAIKMFDGVDPEVFDIIYGQEKFWKVLNSNPNFFRNLEPMEDAYDLYEAVKHLNAVIITGIPQNMDKYDNQKVEWARKYFPDIKQVICCKAKFKCDYAIEGDVLIDDRSIYIKNWVKAGGYYILHKSAKKSIWQLKEWGVL